MEKSVEQVAANLAGALQSGNTQDAVSALADFDALGLEEVADNGPIKVASVEAAEEEEEWGDWNVS